MLVNVASSEVPNLLRVNPGNPDQSYLVQKIQGNAAVGVRMPREQAALSSAGSHRSDPAAGSRPARRRSSAPPDNLTVTSSIPARVGERGCRASENSRWSSPAKSTSSRVSATPSTLRDAIGSAGGDGRRRVCPRAARTSSSSRWRSASPPAAISSRCAATGAVALADNAGHVLDGDADGTPGGDFLMSFDVSAGASR